MVNERLSQLPGRRLFKMSKQQLKNSPKNSEAVINRERKVIYLQWKIWGRSLLDGKWNVLPDLQPAAPDLTFREDKKGNEKQGRQKSSSSRYKNTQHVSQSQNNSLETSPRVRKVANIYIGEAVTRERDWLKMIHWLLEINFLRIDQSETETALLQSSVFSQKKYEEEAFRLRSEMSLCIYSQRPQI